jgi:hypothetical protein
LSLPLHSCSLLPIGGKSNPDNLVEFLKINRLEQIIEDAMLENLATRFERPVAG